MLLKKLLEAASQPLEIADVIKNFPSTYKKLLRAKWGTDELLYKGQKLFDKHDVGPVYDGVITAVEKCLKNGMNVNIEFRGENREVDLRVDLSSSQECYMGFDPKTNQLYSGYDVSLVGDTGEYNDVYSSTFDKLYKDATGVEFDPDSKDKAMRSAWKEYTDRNPLNAGVLCVLTSTDGKNFKASLVLQELNLFYHKNGIYKSREFKQLNLVDLRLD